MHTPRSVVVANVTPPSENETWAGPATFHHVYGPVMVSDRTLGSGVRRLHGPKRTASFHRRPPRERWAGRRRRRGHSGGNTTSARGRKIAVAAGREVVGDVLPCGGGDGRRGGRLVLLEWRMVTGRVLSGRVGAGPRSVGRGSLALAMGRPLPGGGPVHAAEAHRSLRCCVVSSAAGGASPDRRET